MFYTDDTGERTFFELRKNLRIFLLKSYLLAPPYVWWRFFTETQTHKKKFSICIFPRLQQLLSPIISSLKNIVLLQHPYLMSGSRKCFLKFMTSLSGLNDKDLKNGKKKFKGHILFHLLKEKKLSKVNDLFFLLHSFFLLFDELFVRNHLF